jgi:CheY-like chemotaxis protein
MRKGILLLEDMIDEANHFINLLTDLGVDVYHSYNGLDLIDTFNETEGVNFIAAVLDMQIENTRPGQDVKYHLGVSDPKRRGVAVGRKLRELSNFPIVFASSFDTKVQEEKVREAGGLTGAHAFFSKDEVYNNPAVLLRSLDFAVKANEAKEDEYTPNEIVFQEGGFVTLSKIKQEVKIANRQVKAIINRVFHRDEILMFQMTDSVNITITLINGESFLKSNLRKSRFNKAYEAMTKVHPKQDFLLHGPAQGGAVWINKLEILGYDKERIFLKNGDVINIANGMYFILKSAFPTW